MALPPEVEAYARELAARWAAVFDHGLLGVYVHGSAAMSGWTLPLSDVDVLAVLDGPATRAQKDRAAAAIADPEFRAPGAGLEFSIVARSGLSKLNDRPPFELHGATGGGLKIVDGEGHRGDPDLVLHYAVCRERGVAVAGPPPTEMFPVVPREMLLKGVADELDWAVQHAPPRYQVLNALRAWAYAEDGVLLSKFEAVAWARERGNFASLAEAAWEAQAGGPEPGDEAAVRRCLHAAKAAKADAPAGGATV